MPGTVVDPTDLSRERVAALALLLLPVALAGTISGLAVLIIINVLLLGVLIAEHIRIEGHPSAADTAATVTSSSDR